MTPCFSRITALGALAAAVLFILVPPLSAQIGNDNPTGISGIFNGNVNTAGSYDPYTGNATRSITDISVAGAVGEYPLAFTRTMNSRYNSGAGNLEFGPAGNWRHSYQWYIAPIFYQGLGPSAWNYLPVSYSVNYPDGRRVTFTQSTGDSKYRGGPGITDRFQPLTDVNGGQCYLLLSDGGKIVFEAQILREENEQTHIVTSTFTYQFVGIIDPYGQPTTITYPENTNTMVIQEPAGRTLTLHYITTGWNGDTVIDRVVASDGRIVKYNYGPDPSTGQTFLGNVQYQEPDSTLYVQAIYAYQPSNISPSGRMLLWWAIDPMYTGPMWAISYTFRPASEGGVYGQIKSENYLNPFDGMPGQVVSSLAINGNSRTETRGDGPSRTFNYSGGKLQNYTDFKGQGTTLGYDAKGYVNAVIDQRLYQTDFITEPLTGKRTQVTYPLTPPDTVRASASSAYGSPTCSDPNNQDASNPYYICSVTNERGYTTTYRRDTNKRVTRIDYPNGAFEEFTYTSLGQVATHTKSSGGTAGVATETYTYDPRHRLETYIPPATPSDTNPGTHPTRYYYYEPGRGRNLDRPQSVVDPRGNGTWYEYNWRGQTTKLTHQDSSSAQMGYNVDGTLAWAADENHPGAVTDATQRMRFVYDIYKRVLETTNPEEETAYTSYAPWNGTGSYSHTTSSVYVATSPTGKITHFDYNENFRRKTLRAAPNTPDDASTLYDYDPAGNLKSVEDPRHNITTFGYDERNRRKDMTNPAPFSNEITRWEYDKTNNLKKEIRPDLSFRRIEYDVMGGVMDTYGFANEHTHFDRDLAGNVYQMIDVKGAIYGYGYDALNRKISATYPADAFQIQRTESWEFDVAGNMDLYRNQASEYQHIDYDNRNRPWHTYWNWFATSTTPDWFGPEVTSAFDLAGRMTSVATKLWQSNNNETLVSFGYDDANRKLWEEQTVYGHPTRRIETNWNDDGLPESLVVPAIGWVNVQYAYNQRNQLERINDAYGNYWFKYDYDLNGNMTKRQNVWAGINNATRAEYDELNRPKTWENSSAGAVVFARSHQQYDNLSRMTATHRDEQGKGDRFWYTPEGQLNVTEYNADNVFVYPQNWDRWVGYTHTPDTLNRSNINDSGTVTNYTPNPVNQYTDVGGLGLSYDGNFNLTAFNGLAANYNASNRMISASKNGAGAQFVYDGLGRCLKRTVNNVSTILLYDGWKPVIEFDGANNLVAWNAYGPGADEILYRWSPSGGETYYHTDERGNVRFLLDGGGNGVEEYFYDVFGQPTAIADWSGHGLTASAFGNRFMFQGREWIPELGIYDYRNRMYHPQLGRFLQQDPLGFGGGDSNFFRYCGGDPVNFGDPSGEDPVYHPRGNFFTYVTSSPVTLMNGYAGPSQHCAAGCQVLTGAPHTTYWRQGDPVSANTMSGTVIAAGWQNGRYPSLNVRDYHATYGVNAQVNHAVIFIGFVSGGNIMVVEQMVGVPLRVNIISPRGFSTVTVGAADQFNHGGSGGGGRGGGGQMPVVPSIEAGVSGALTALSAYASTHGPGIGLVTVRDSNGTRVVAIRDLRSFSYGGTTYVNGVPVRGLGSPLISTGGGGPGGWEGIAPGWASFPGPQAGEGFHPSGEP